jgi:hypothetical protein
VRWGETTTINDALEAWSCNGWQDLSPTTVRHYRELWDRHVRKAIGRRAIASLNPYEIERYFRRLKDAGVGSTTVHLGRPASAGRNRPKGGGITQCKALD